MSDYVGMDWAIWSDTQCYAQSKFYLKYLLFTLSLHTLYIENCSYLIMFRNLIIVLFFSLNRNTCYYLLMTKGPNSAL